MDLRIIAEIESLQQENKMFCKPFIIENVDYLAKLKKQF